MVTASLKIARRISCNAIRAIIMARRVKDGPSNTKSFSPRKLVIPSKGWGGCNLSGRLINFPLQGHKNPRNELELSLELI